MLREDRRDLRMRFDAQQRFVERGARFLQVLARAGPLRHDGGEEIERAQLRAAEIRARREEVGEHLPVQMQPRARTRAGCVPSRLASLSASAHQRSGCR